MKKRTPQSGSQRRDNAARQGSGNGKLSMALRYAQEGIAVVPLHGLKGDCCTCGNPACDQTGMHPRTQDGVRGATIDSKVIKRQWEEWPKAKIGIVFGRSTSLVGLAIKGEAGWTSLRKLMNSNEKHPWTITILDRIDGEDREIRLYRCNDDTVTKRQLADGLEFLGDGDFVAAPSMLEDSSKGRRRFRSDRGLGQITIAPAPSWLSKKATNSPALIPPAPAAIPSVVLVPTSEIQPEPVTWIWPGVIASGRVTSLVGHPGRGKSQVSIDIAATISTGRPWPRGTTNERAGHVLLLSAEDDAADTIVPRLIAAGADLTAVHLVKAVKDDDGVERAFSLVDDLERLGREHDLGQVRLLIVDPITAYLGRKCGAINRNQGSDVRALLDHLTAFSARHDLGVLAISHLNKSSGASAITRIMGSLDFVAVARAVYLVTEEPDSSRRLFLPVKNNIAADRVGYAFELASRIVRDGIQTSAVIWSDDPVTISADEALAAAGKKASSGAMDFLRETLSDGPVDQVEIMRRGDEAGFTEKNLRTASKKLGVTSKREGGVGAAGRWVWHPLAAPKC